MKRLPRVRHEKIIEMLTRFNDNREDIPLIKNLYWQQRANVRINGKATKTLCEIQKRVRQGCPLSLRLFNLYAEMIAQKSAHRNADFKVNGERIDSISYADDKVLIAETATDGKCAERSREKGWNDNCLLYTSPSPRDRTRSRMPSSA